MMATAEANGAATLGENTSEMAELTGSAVLVVIGEPFTAEHKELILERITKGFRVWDEEATGCDINAELSALASSAPTGEDGPNGEVIIQYTSPAINVTTLINPQCATVSTHLRQLLISGGKHRHLMYTGHTIQGSGDWLLQDDTFTYEKFAEIAKSTDVENALKQQEGGSLDVSVFDEGNWKEANMAKQSFAKLLKVRVNPEEKLSDINGILQFSAYLTFFVKVRTIKELLKASDVVGNIRFSRPTLYIFPGSQGDSALFGISGFNLLVNGGYSRKSCFWDFTRHLDRIDAVLNTHLSADNFMGVSSVLERKATENVHPEIGFMYMNAIEKSKHSPNGDAQPENGGSHKPASLLVSLVDEGNKIIQNLKLLGQNPSPCIGRITGSQLDPITLYHKVGHGTLDMFVLNPLQDNKEIKEFLSQWNKDVNNFSMVKGGNRGGNIPLPSMVSICALLVWRPSVPTEKITRILFPGSAPQSRIFEGLDKLKNMDIFQHETCSEKTLHAPKAAAKKPAAAGKPTRAPTPKSTPAPKAEPKKVAEKKPVKVEKGAKEETNKKALEKKGKKSPTSSKSTTPASMTPSQSASEVSSPQHEKAPSPLESPKEVMAAVEKNEEAPVDILSPQDAPQLETVKDETTVKVEESSKPEADQAPAPVLEPEPAPVVAEPTQSPEPLPDPAKIENTTFESSAPAAPVEEVVAEPEKVVPVEAAPQETAPEPEAVPEPAHVEPEPAPAEALPAEPAASESLISLEKDSKEEAPKEEQMKPVEVETVEAVQPTQLEPTPAAALDDKRSLEDLGIYDDEKDVDTAEITHSAASQASSQAADDQGLVDDEPESLKPVPTEPLIDMGFSDKVEAEQVVATEAAPAEVAQAAPVIEDDGAASQQPEADQMVFGGAAPEGLPEPAEPVLEPEMCMEQEFLDQIQQGVVGLKETDMPPVPEPETVAALVEQQSQKFQEPAVEEAPEPTSDPLPESLKVESEQQVSQALEQPESEVTEEHIVEAATEPKMMGSADLIETEAPMALEPEVEQVKESVTETAPESQRAESPVVAEQEPLKAPEAELEEAQEPVREAAPESQRAESPVVAEQEPPTAPEAELEEASPESQRAESPVIAEQELVTEAAPESQRAESPVVAKEELVTEAAPESQRAESPVVAEQEPLKAPEAELEEAAPESQRAESPVVTEQEPVTEAAPESQRAESPVVTEQEPVTEAAPESQRAESPVVAEQQPSKTPEAELEEAQEPVTEAVKEPQVAQSPEIEMAEEPKPEDEQGLTEMKAEDKQVSSVPAEPLPVQTLPDQEVELATEPQVEAARESELEVAQEPDMELPEDDRIQEALPEPEPEVEVELAEKAELMPEDSTPHQVSNEVQDEALSDHQPLELAAKADEDVAETVPQPAVELPEPAVEAAEASHAEEVEPTPEKTEQVMEQAALPVEEAEEAAEMAQPAECAACDDRKLFPDEPESTAEIVSSPEPQSPVEEALEAAEAGEDLECKACDERNLFPEEDVPQSVSPLPMETDEHSEKEDHSHHSEKSGMSSEEEHDIAPHVGETKEETKDCKTEKTSEETHMEAKQSVELPSPVDEVKVAAEKVGHLEQAPEERDAISPELPAHDSEMQVSGDVQHRVEESLVEQGTTERLQVAELEDLPTPSEPSLSEQYPVTDHDEDSSAYDKEHDGDDDSLQHQHSAMDTSLEGSLPPSNNPFEIIDGPTRPVDPMSMSFFDDGTQSTNPFLGMDGGGPCTGLPSDIIPTIPQTTNGLPQDQNQNPFDLAPSVTPSVQALQHEGVERDSLEREEDTFDPLKEWGQPMGLPAPAPPSEKAAEKGTTKRPASAATKKADPKKTGPTAKAGVKKVTDTKTGAAKKDAPKKEPSTPRKEAPKREPVKKDIPKREPPKPKNGPTTSDKLKNGTAKDAKNVAAPKPAPTPVKKEALKTKKAPAGRPATAPAKSESARSEATKRESPRPTATTKRPATASKAPTAKAPTPTPVVPFYVDLTYVPNHGDMHYVDLDFFRRVRARYYVISALNPSPGVLNALLEAKQMWENPDAEVTLIPTYDTETLRHWMGLHRDQLSQLKIDVAPSASRCTIQLQDHETSCAAYRLEF